MSYIIIASDEEIAPEKYVKRSLVRASRSSRQLHTSTGGAQLTFYILFS